MNEFELMMYPPTNSIDELIQKAIETATCAYSAKEITGMQLDVFLYELHNFS